ncbi:hypothetical protein QMK19_35210 [Streptomyces sp. H10-C2]|uniref:hypothetical protein n=1 Tax=unclassified Streptomyces TaxID=2593676 RepID=UPI0024BA70D2|nr:MULTISPECIES: hypothetical protein [unclassified Streptomyces]MDJ0345884.1 hypothetical protein [Streptomyces sp. PH10-H1]MDJ0374733.1 hypothetical protein [Streptomyces sp. H10-C2]
MDLLAGLVDSLGPQVQMILSTTDRPTALMWQASLIDQGVEGLVIKGLATRYNPRDTRAWLKHRVSDTIDARVIGVVGTVWRPRAVVVELEGRAVVTSPRLDATQAAAVAAAVHGRTGRPEFVPDLDATVVAVADGPMAEILVGHGRHRAVRFARLRDEEEP